MWWTDGSRSDDGRVVAAPVCNDRNEWRARRRFLGTGRMVVLNAKLSVMGLALNVAIGKRDTLHKH